MKIDFDIDIDVANREEILKLINHVPASIQTKAGKKKHNTGVYFQNVPVDPATGFCGIDYESAGDIGFLKIDFLNNHVYANIRDEEHLNKLLEQEPMWELLEHPEVVETLFQIHNHYDLVQQYRPQSVNELAMLLAIMRPGKAHLQGQPWEIIQDSVWQKSSSDKYFFKRSHAIAYAMVIVVQLNLLVEQTTQLA
jgi:DNA polymerase III alpha subunit